MGHDPFARIRIFVLRKRQPINRGTANNLNLVDVHCHYGFVRPHE